MTTAPIFQEPQPPSSPSPEPEFDLDTPTAEAPYGYRIDSEGQTVPKKTMGRRPKSAAPATAPGVSPSLEELRAAGPRERAEDVAPTPGTGSKVMFGKGTKAPKEAPAPPAPTPPFRPGPIAKGVNKLYRRAGKILKIWDPMLGAAVIASTIKGSNPDPEEEGEESITVGEAWEEIARINPRIRRFLLKAVETSAWGNLFMAHAPIVVALMMKESIQRVIPFGRLISALMTPDEDDQEQEFDATQMMMGGMGPQDLAQMLGAMQAMMPGMFADMPRGMNETRGTEPGEQKVA